MRKFSAVLLILVLSCLLAYPVLADDNVYSDHDLRYFRDYDELSCAPTTVGKPAAKDNLPKIYNYFIAKGVSKEIAAAIVGNISQESNEGDPLYKQGGGRTDKPASVGLYADGTRFENKPGQKSGIGKAWGLSQWDPGNAVIYWAEQSGMKGSVPEIEAKVSTLGGQLEVLWWQFNNVAPTSQRNILGRLKKVDPDVDKMVAIIAKKFHGAGKPNMPRRISEAHKALSFPINPAAVGNILSVKDNSLSAGCFNNLGPIAEGGLNREQGKAFVMSYGENKNGETERIVGDIWNNCNGGGSNCVTFSKFFMKKFTKKKIWAGGNGGQVVSRLREAGVPTGEVPRVGAIFSWRDDDYGHTGVVLGIKDGKVIVGHASCSNQGRGAGNGEPPYKGRNTGVGAAFILEGDPKTGYPWYGQVPTEFAYPEVNIGEIEKYLNGISDRGNSS